MSPTAKAVPTASNPGIEGPDIAKPKRARPADISAIMPHPRRTPITEPTTPIMSAWMITVLNTWLGLAPTERRRAYPRIDSRTIMEKVLAIMNVPTKSAMKANIRIIGWTNPIVSLILSFCSERRVSPVTALALCFPEFAGAFLICEPIFCASASCWDCVRGFPLLVSP